MVDGCAYLGSFLLASRNLGIWTGDKEWHSRLRFDQSEGCSCPEIRSVTSIIGPLSAEMSLSPRFDFLTLDFLISDILISAIDRWQRNKFTGRWSTILWDVRPPKWTRFPHNVMSHWCSPGIRLLMGSICQWGPLNHSSTSKWFLRRLLLSDFGIFYMLALFPGPCQLFISCSTGLITWAGDWDQSYLHGVLFQVIVCGT